MPAAFPGFPSEGMAFLRALVKNNRREWFQPRKAVYEEQVKAPMLELVTRVTSAMLSFAPAYAGDPNKAIFRIYRDTRFSKDKTPYKTHIAAVFHRRGLDMHGGGGFYFAVSAKEIEVAAGIYMPAPETLRKVRAHISGRHEEFRDLIGGRTLRRLLGDMQGEQISRVPKGFSPDHPAADLLRYKQFLFWTMLDPALATTPKLEAEIVKRFRALAPFLEFLNAPLAEDVRLGLQADALRERPR
jgi:uncharacterized protein (TIGR02453 family)